jgi:ribosome-associated protein
MMWRSAKSGPRVQGDNMSTRSLPRFISASASSDLNFLMKSKFGVIVIKSQKYRSQEKNIEAGMERLNELISRAFLKEKPRKATRPSQGSKLKRLEAKKKRGESKMLRGKVDY